MARLVPVVPRDKDPKDPLPPTDLYGGGDGKNGNVYSSAGAAVLKGYGADGKNVLFTTSTDMKNFVERLIFKNDPRLNALMAAMGIGNKKVLKEVWNDLADYTFDVMGEGKKMDIFKVYGSKKFSQYGLKLPKGAGGGPTSQSYVTITTKKEANDFLRQTMFDMLGRAPSDAEYKDFLTKLNKAENKIFKTTTYTSTGQRTTGRMIDPKAFAERYVLGKVSFKEDLAGGAGLIQDTVNQLINNNGLVGYVTDKKKREWMRALAKGELTNDTLLASIRDESKKVYSAFAGLLDANPTMSLYDVADPYISVYARMFELGEAQVDFTDVLKKAVKVGPDGKESLMSVFEYQKSLRTDPKFQYTSTAKNEAQDMGTAFARAFGVNI
jgi:hypothetical protein